MATATQTNAKRTTGKWGVKVSGAVVDTIIVKVNRKGGPDSGEYRYEISGGDWDSGTDDRDEVRQMVADEIRRIRDEEIEAQRDRDNDDLDEAIESIKDAGKARKALEVLRAAGLIG